MSHAIYACDVGSVRSGAFAWARVVPDGGNPIASSSIDELVEWIVNDVRTEHRSIALGFESPLFMPVPATSSELSRGRSGEGSRSMFAPAGAMVTTLGLHEVAWVLRSMKELVGDALTYTLDVNAWQLGSLERMLCLWEAFVSERAHGTSHEQDASTAAMAFRKSVADLASTGGVTAENPLSIVHAAALWAGWASDLERLHVGCSVVRPSEPYLGPIDHA